MYLGFFSGVIIAFFLTSASSVSYAADPSLTQEQLRQLQQLPAAEREALLRALQSGAPARQGKIPGGPELVQPQPTVAPPEPDIDLSGLQAPRIKGGDTILVRFIPAPKAGPAPQLFVLDRFGGLVLPEVGRIILAGLNADQAAARLAVEPAFEGVLIEVELLPVEKELKAFGYDLFVRAREAFAPATDIPIPAGYVLGPGDSVLVQLFGKRNVEYELVITRDGLLLFPELGPIPVAGLRFSQLRRRIRARVENQLIGVKASVTLGRLRSIRVFVLGNVERPGSYTVSGLSTLTNALLMSGGIKRSGSLRSIELKRQGKVVSRMDLYDLLLRGDTRADVRLLPGDVIFVPPIGRTAGVGGWVRRPAVYELKDERTVQDLIRIAGGLLPDAFAQATQITRILASGERILMDVDLTKPEFQPMRVRDGDVVRVAPALERVERVVTLTGSVQRPGDYQWVPGMRLIDLIPSVSHLLPEVDARYLLVQRENPADRKLELLSANLIDALEDPESAANLVLQPRDRVRVFDLQTDRSTVIEPLLDRIMVQSSPEKPVPEISIIGTVHHPGRYPLSSNMKVSDLLTAAGGLSDRSYTLEAELTRFRVVDGKKREQRRWDIDLERILARPNGELDITLAPYDQINIRRIPNWDDVGTIEVIGEVKFSGTYVVARGEMLSNVIKRVGGLTDEAYPRGAVFTRESVRQREQEQLERLALQLEKDLVVIRAEAEEIGVDKERALNEARLLLQRIRGTKAVGRMVISLDAILQDQEEFDIRVQPGDKLIIRQRPEVVTVVGEVYHATTRLLQKKLKRDDVIRLSGGVTERGNKKAIFVVHADGSVSPPRGPSGGNIKMAAGDVIVVPLKVDRINKMKLITDITQIIFQLAFSAAAIAAID